MKVRGLVDARALAATLIALLGGACASKAAPSTLDVLTPDADAPDALPICPGVDQSCWASLGTVPQQGCVDQHCVAPDGGTVVNPINYASCGLVPSSVEVPATSTDAATWAGALDTNDDSCAYHVRALAQCTSVSRQLSLSVELSSLANGAAIAGAKPYVEVFQGYTHASPDSGAQLTETSPGTYRIAGIVFDRPGQWTIELHFFGTCHDVAGSPHTHASFLVDVP